LLFAAPSDQDPARGVATEKLVGSSLGSSPTQLCVGRSQKNRRLKQLTWPNSALLWQLTAALTAGRLLNLLNLRHLLQREYLL
jgi:hypothetical protein